MKKIIFLILGALPVILCGQNKCSFFEYRKPEIKQTNINTVASDFGPAIVHDKLMYASFSDEDINKLARGDSRKIFYDIFLSTLNSNGDAGSDRQMILSEFSKGYHAGPVSYCKNTGELFVTLSNYQNPEIKNKVYRKANIRLKLISLKPDNGKWILQDDFPFNDSLYSVGHPAISVTGDTLFFASDRPDMGFGRTDIYMSVRKDGNWMMPQNLGEKINSPGDDMFPFFFRNMLFYASNKGTEERKDFDIYYACLENGRFSKPVKLDFLNTEYDDFGLIINSDGEYGYFVSNRPGGKGDDDIYKIEFTGEYFLELVIMDRKTGAPVDNPVISFSDNVTAEYQYPVFKRELPAKTTTVATSKLEGYQNSSVTISTQQYSFGIIRDTIWVEKVEVGQKFVMENIFYEFDKWDILPESEVELNKLVKILKDNPSWKVELGSHTDCRGSDAYNLKLSQKRSDSAVSYIVKNGISADRIIARGYGETQLVNRCDDGVDCTEEEHRQNRRTEFKILEME